MGYLKAGIILYFYLLILLKRGTRSLIKLQSRYSKYTEGCYFLLLLLYFPILDQKPQKGSANNLSHFRFVVNWFEIGALWILDGLAY